jgi:homoserine O-succinyltransferase
MPIKIPTNLPAASQLAAEGVPLIGEEMAKRQDIRPLRVALLNLMPDKPKTETQLARLLGASPLQVELALLTTSTYRPNNVPLSHLQSFYQTWQEVKEERFDGLIVTGAPIELLPFEEVKYWKELCQIYDWSRTHTHSQLFICWGAQAALYHFHGVPKHPLASKRFGIYVHYVTEQSDSRRPTLLRGFDDYFSVPVSRHTEVRAADLPAAAGLNVLATSNAAGLCLLHEPRHRTVYMFNHLEYDTYTLRDEYIRDAHSRETVALPVSYFPDDDPEKPPRNCWRAYAHLLFGNWLNEVYQTTPYDIGQIGSSSNN